MRRLAARASTIGLGMVFALALGAAAQAQEIEPREFLPLPNGTNLAIGYYIHGSQENFYSTSGSKVPGSNLEVNLGLARYVHYTYVAGMPAGFQLLQTFGTLSDVRLGGENFEGSSGAGNTALSVFIWPYSNPALNQHLNVTAFLYPPDGTYDKNHLANLSSTLSGSTGWAGDLQIGWDHAIGPHFSYDISLDTHFYGDTTAPVQPGVPISVRTHHDNDFRGQLWLNWAWNRALTTAVGWEGVWGGDTYFSNPVELGGFGHTSVGSGRFQRIRAAASMFLSPRFQLLLEGNHDVYRGGGYEQTWGLTLRALYVF